MAGVSEEIKTEYASDRVYVGADMGDRTAVLSIHDRVSGSENIALLNLAEMRRLQAAVGHAVRLMEGRDL